MADRTVYAECEGFEVVRYNRAGKWYVEPKNPERPATHVGVAEAADRAYACAVLGGKVHVGLPGGRAFDLLFVKVFA